MTKIIGFGHFKQSGKSTSAVFLSNHIYRLPKIKELSDPIMRDFNGDRFEFSRSVTSKIYSFADKLKEFCVECLGLTEQQVNGSDEDKNSFTKIKWKDTPTFNSPAYQSKGKGADTQAIKAEYMTAREVMQYFGTSICRKMYPNVWIDATIRQIKKDNLDFALIADCRFRNEAEALQKVGGRVIGFTRRPFPEDTHESEIDLIGYPFDKLIDNTNMTLDEKNQAALRAVQEWGWL